VVNVRSRTLVETAIAVACKDCVVFRSVVANLCFVFSLSTRVLLVGCRFTMGEGVWVTSDAVAVQRIPFNSGNRYCGCAPLAAAGLLTHHGQRWPQKCGGLLSRRG